MGRRGPKPEPTALKLAKGNPGRRPLNTLEPEPELGVPPCPDHLDALGREAWHQLGRELEEAGVISELDVLAFELLCDAYSRYRRLREEFERERQFIVTMSTGVTAQNPKLKVLREEIKLLNDMLSQFGMSPATRSGVRRLPPKSGLGDFLKGATA